MTTYTVQLAYAAYYCHDESVEADSLAAALAKAIDAANASSAWSSSDDCGPTFVEAVAEGDVDLWDVARVDHHLPIPSRFTEQGDGPRVIVTLSGGIVEKVEIDGGPARVEVRDYDIEGTSDPGDIQTDQNGGRYLSALWSNLIPADEAG